MTRAMKILLQTTISTNVDDWSIARFGQLAGLLKEIRDGEGRAQFEVTARDRDPLGAPDSLLSTLDRSDFDQMWLFAVDIGDGLTAEDCEGIAKFRRVGGGLMVTRDHMDLGSSICSLAGVGLAHHFHTKNIDPTARLERDDAHSLNISWPNFHSGANGDYQTIQPMGAIHAVLLDPSSPTGALRFLPSHPHEGAVSAPINQHARVIATGTSKATGRSFNLAVAFEAHGNHGRAVAQSTFHHFADYNWDPRVGAPSFVDEPPGDAILRDPIAIKDTRRYASNLALWLGGRGS
jgi:hypothetical protein